MKKQTGITLIALVITIIVLLILSAVTIGALTGESGLLTKASNAHEETSKGIATEKINLKITSVQMKSYAEEQKMPDLQYLASELEKDTGEDGDLEYVDIKTHNKKENATARSLGRIASINDEILLSSIDIGNSKSIFTKLKEYPYEFEIDSSLKLASIDGLRIADTDTNTVTVTKEQYDELLSEINALKTRVGELETDKLTWTELASTNSTSGNTPITLSKSLTEFKYVQLVFDGGTAGNRWYSGLVPVEEFSNCFGDSDGIGVAHESKHADCKYVSANSVNLSHNADSGAQVILYGVK